MYTHAVNRQGPSVKEPDSIIHGGTGLYKGFEHAVGTHGDAAFASAAVLGIFDNHVPVKPDVQFCEYVVFAFADAVPAGLALVGIYADIFGAFPF